jgi:hypothetical protein
VTVFLDQLWAALRGQDMDIQVSCCPKMGKVHRELLEIRPRVMAEKQNVHILPWGFGGVSIVWRSFILLMSYRYIESSSTTTRRFLLICTLMILVGKVSSHIVAPFLVLSIRSNRGESTSACNEVEKSTSTMETWFSLHRYICENGSVLYVRKPFPEALAQVS